jgi:hypothetical protein
MASEQSARQLDNPSVTSSIRYIFRYRRNALSGSVQYYPAGAGRCHRPFKVALHKQIQRSVTATPVKIPLECRRSLERLLDENSCSVGDVQAGGKDEHFR